jgi:hypothetical protein
LNHHVAEAKAGLNFSEFAAYSPKRAARKLRSAADEVHDWQMPLLSYRLLHGEARLSEAEVKLLTGWAEDLADEIESRQPDRP